MKDLEDFLKKVRTLTSDNYVSYFQDTVYQDLSHLYNYCTKKYLR